MRLPLLFRQVHQRQLERGWRDHGPVFRIIPREPLGHAETNPSKEAVVSETITVVTVRCIRNGDVVRFEAFSPADLEVAARWAEKHRDTPIEDFTWMPSLSGGDK